MMMPTVLVVLLVLVLGQTAQAAVKTELVDYRSGDTALQGYLACDSRVRGPRPGVLVFHEFWGLNDYPKERARQLAQMGYVAFAADVYGKGVVAKTPEEAGKLAGQFRSRWDEWGRAEMRRRAQAALDVIAHDRRVDAKRIGAIGFCFGGTCALELAYSGAHVRGVVSFHGGLTVPAADDLPRVRASVLILHGASDASAKPETITELQKALTEAKVDWQMVYYGGAVHAFTNPANTATTGNARYDPKAARRSWAAMQDFFGEVLR